MKYIYCFLTFTFLTSNGFAQKIDERALENLLTACKKNHSAGLAIWVNNQPYKDYTFDNTGQKTAAFSAHKSLISLAIGKLVTDGKLTSIDSPVCAYYPEWKQGLKKTITIRHLLTHTSAVEYTQADPDGWDAENIVQYALCASLLDTPGHYFYYNDRAVDILRGIIEKVSGKKMDKYIGDVLFKPMNITDYEWEYDKAGNPKNLVITPAEFVKLGQLVLNNGTWEGKRLVSAEWIKESLEQSQPFCAQLWPALVAYSRKDYLYSKR